MKTPASPRKAGTPRRKSGNLSEDLYGVLDRDTLDLKAQLESRHPDIMVHDILYFPLFN